MTTLDQPDGIHTIPVPRGMSIEQAWENIARGATLLDPMPEWANVRIESGKLVEIIRTGTGAFNDLLQVLNALSEQVGACKEDALLKNSRYQAVWLGLCDAADGLRAALDGWPA